MLTLCVRANHWTPDEYQYSNNMTLIGVIAFDDVEQRSESLEIGAFCAEECRGSAIAQYDTNFDRYYVCIMIYGNDGDSISIRCYDHGIGMEVDAVSQTSFIFNTNDMIGNAVEPVVFSFDLPEIPEEPEDPIYYQVTAEANPLAGGTIDGVGEYLENDTCTLQITTSLNYVYEGFYENDTLVTNDTIYSFVVISDRHFVAKFSENTEEPIDPEIPVDTIYYKVTAEANPLAGGTIDGVGEYLENDTCTLQITTSLNYVYEGLFENDKLVTNDTIYSFVVALDRHFVAKFISTESIEEKTASFQFYPNPVNDKLYIETEMEIEGVVVYDAFGRQQTTDNGQQSSFIDVSGLNVGVYLVMIKTDRGVVTKHFVKE